MKRFSEILLVSILIIPTQFSIAQQVEDVLQRIERNIQTIEFLSYHSSFVNINPTVEDSIFKASATIWLKRVPSDSIFGAHFHVRGKDKNSTFDYHYDGQNSYEIRHEDKQVTIFYPHKYPNTPNNPAKARTALSPFRELLIDENFKNTVLQNNPKTTIQENIERNTWIITLYYPKNEWDQELTKSFEIDKKTFLIKRIDQQVKWRGVTYKTEIDFSNYKQNVPSISENIKLKENYEQYSQKEFTRNKTQTVDPYIELIGKAAPNFNFTSFSGIQLSLDQFKGKLILLDFWESWCGYCMLAMPKLNKLQRNYGESELKVIGIVTENKQQIEKLIKANNLIYSNIYADKDILNDYHVSARPTYILIDQNGKIATVSTGDLEKIENKIKDLAK